MQLHTQNPCTKSPVCLQGMRSHLYPVILLLTLTKFCLKRSHLVLLGGGRRTLLLSLLLALFFWRDCISRLLWRWKCVKLQRSLRGTENCTIDPSLEGRFFIQMWWTDGRREKVLVQHQHSALAGSCPHLDPSSGLSVPQWKCLLGSGWADLLRCTTSASRNAVCLSNSASNTSPRLINKFLWIQLRSRHHIFRTQVQPGPLHLALISAGFSDHYLCMIWGVFPRSCVSAAAPQHMAWRAYWLLCAAATGEEWFFWDGLPHGPPSWAWGCAVERL